MSDDLNRSTGSARSLDPAALEALSALWDGEACARDAAHGCALWREHAGVREQGQHWALIGDALRSADLKHCRDRDLRFLAKVSERLAAEPAILAPGALAGWRDQADDAADTAQAQLGQAGGWMPPPAASAARPRSGRSGGGASVLHWPQLLAARGTWAVGGAALAVGAAALMWRAPALEAGAPSAAPSAVDLRLSDARVPEEEAPQMIRNSDLDRYLYAHRQAAQGPAMAAPGALVRPVSLANEAP